MLTANCIFCGIKKLLLSFMYNDIMFLEEFSSFRDSILKYSWMKQISWGGEKRWDKVGHKFIIFKLVISQWRFIILCSSLLYLCRVLYLVIFFNGNDWTKWSLRLFLFLIFCNLLFSINYLSLICPFQEPSNLNWLHLFMHASWNILRSGARKKITNPYCFFFFFLNHVWSNKTFCWNLTIIMVFI